MLFKFLIVWLVFFLASQHVEGASSSDCLSAHNYHRRRHGVNPLTMDDKLTRYAKWRARHMAATDEFEHVDSNFGENLAFHSDVSTSCKELVDLWYAEQDFYDYKQPPEAGQSETGHFTQLVWASTSRVGCATGQSQLGLYLVCVYDPPARIQFAPGAQSAAGRGSHQQEQIQLATGTEPQTELMFTNQTGALLTCAAASELARSVLQAERSLSSSPLASTLSSAGQEQLNGRSIREIIPDLQVRWLRPETGEELEDDEELEGSESSGESASGQTRPLRWFRAQDGALVFEPFKPSEFRAEIHAGAYKCVASSQARSASLAGPSIRVRALIVSGSGAGAANQQQQQQLPEVLDELVLAGSSALFRCQLPAHLRDLMGVIEWIEYPSERVISFGTSTVQHANKLFKHANSELMQGASSLPDNVLTSGVPAYFVAPHSGDLHIVNVDTTFNYRAYRCRCKNKLTGELLSSTNKGKLIVTEAHASLAPRIVAEATSRTPIHEEAELALLACNVQSYPKAHFTWFKRQQTAEIGASLTGTGEEQLELLRTGNNQRIAQVANLLLINKVQQNDSGSYLCLAQNTAGEERLDLELLVKAPLRVKLSASAHVLELGKSLALDCTVSGFPIQQVLFRHNQNLIKSINGPQQQHSTTSGHSQVHQLSSGSRALLRKASDYFVVDESLGGDGVTISNNVASSLHNNNNHQQQQQQQFVDTNGQQQSSNKLSHVIVIVLEPQHAGAYQCVAQNQYESVQSSAYIKVLDDPPKFKETFKSSVLERGQDVSLRCAARANPLPEITWSIDEQPIPETSRVRFGDFVTKENLVISYVNISGAQVADGGFYKCSANNGLAQMSHQAQISVVGPPQVKAMANLTVVASTSFRIRCPAVGYPITEIQWLHAGKRLPANHRQHVFENGTLEVEHMERAQDDDGTYTCLAHQPGSPPGQGSLEVSIKARPTIEPFSVSRSLREGQRASITCTISSGDLPISIQWLHNDRPLLLMATTSDQQHQQPVASSTGAPRELPNVRVSRASDYSSTLLFESLMVEHSGNYTCLAQNDAGSVSHQAPMVVQVAPKWSLEPGDTNVVRGSSSSIDCMASGFPAPRVIWTKASPGGEQQNQAANSALLSSSGQQQQQLQLQLQQSALLTGLTLTTQSYAKTQHPGSWRSIVSSPHLQVFENGSLNLLEARDNHAGYYMCQASNGVGPGLSKVIRVTINVAAQFNSRQAVQYVDRNEEAQLKCQAKGDAPTQIHWFKNRHRLEPVGGQASGGVSSGVLLVASVAAPASGASLAQLQASALRLGSSVLEQLMLLIGPSSSSSSIQDAAHTRTGSIDSSAQPQRALIMDRYTLTSSESALAREQQISYQGASELSPQLVQVSSTLSIVRAERQDTATFKCFAANNFGVDERTIQLVVQEPPERVEELSVLEVNSRSLTLAWLAPFDGNSPISAYHVQYRPLTSSLPAPLTGSSNSQSSTLTPEWFNFTLSASSLSSQASNINNNSTNPPGRALVRANVGSLKPQTQYWFRVSAENRLGRGQVSGAIESLTMEEAPGAAPTKLHATPQSSSSILVSWSRPNEKEIFGSLHGYYVAYKPIHPPPDQQQRTSGGVSSLSALPANQSDNLNELIGAVAATSIYKTIAHDDKKIKFDALLTGLKRSTRYLISVQAFNGRGTGPATEPIQVRTLEMDPPRQVRLLVRQASNCSIQLEWRPLSAQAALSQQQATNQQQTRLLGSSKSNEEQQADSNLYGSTSADSVDYYSLYQAELNERPHWVEIRLPGHSVSHSVENLKCGARYQFYMVGVNRVGVGDQSDILDTKTAGGLPLAPDRQSTFDVLNTTCYLVRLDHWQDNGCPITQYNIRYKVESARDWVQVAHFNIPQADSLAHSSTDISGESGHHSTGQATTTSKQRSLTNQMLELDLLRQNSRAKRQVNGPSDQLTLDSSSQSDESLLNGSGEAAEDAFLDYSVAADYSAPVLSTDQGVGSSIDPLNLSKLVKGGLLPSKQLFNLLKDSMLPTFGDSYNSFNNSPVQAEWSAPQDENLLNQRERPSSDIAPADLTKQLGSWRKVRLCNLLENTYYIVQISAANSVGETEAELRILTSPEGLEYDHEIKRHVIGKLGGIGSRLAQPVAMSDRLSLFALSQWPVLVPVLLTLTLMAIIVAATLLLKRANASARSPSTTTTTTTTTGGSGNCNGDFLHKHHHHHLQMNSHHPDVVHNGFVSGYRSGPLDQVNMSNSHQLQSIYQQRSNQSIFEEPTYGLLNHLMPAQTGGNETNRSSGSPATTTNNTVSTQSNSNTNSNHSNHSATSNGHFNPNTLYMPSRQQANEHLAMSAGSAATLGRLNQRNVYLCTQTTKEEPANLNSLVKPDAQLFYGMTAPAQKSIQFHGPTPTAHQILQGRPQFTQQDNSLLIEDKDATYLQAYQTTQAGPESYDRNMKQQGNGNTEDNKQMDNCFLTIVEEVVRANESHNQQRAIGVTNNQNNSKQETHLFEQQQQVVPNSSQCQPDCLNQLFTANGTNYGSLSTNLEAQQTCKQQVLEQNGQVMGKPMFDPVYATIRRTFPQAFRYLTLQQQQQHQHHYHNQQQQQQADWNQCNSLANDDSIILSQQQRHHSYALGENPTSDLTLFQSDNLAALNLLTPVMMQQQQTQTNSPSANLSSPQQINNRQ